LVSLRYVKDAFGAESQASEDAGVVAIHAALTALLDMAASHVGGVRPTGLTSTFSYQPPIPADQTHTLTLKLFPVDSIELSIMIEDETLPSLPNDEASGAPD